MGGIGGVRTLSAGACTTDVLHEMAALLHHRGPDGSAVWMGQDVGLAHTRLGVLEAHASGQPVHSVDGRWVLALDGAIANQTTLRSSLDYPFRTSGDAEVVVAGLALEGISFAERLQGQYALVAHDLRTDTTHLVRDRLGILPLHYRHVPGGIAFASEVKALLAVGPPPQVDHRSLDAYLAGRSVPAPDTLFEGVKKVRPAHRISITADGHVEEVRTWVPPEADPDASWSTSDAIEAVADGVREAVRSALVADVPVGAFLSGGLDSSLVVAQMQQLRGDDPVHTFSADFGDHAQDEPWARRVSRLLGTRHHEVRLGSADLADLWELLTWHRDAPLSDPADLAPFGLAREAREHVGVVLTGVGGDELFGGCFHHRFAGLAERSRALPEQLRRRLAGPVERRLDERHAAFTAPERQRLLGAAPPAERRAAPTRGADAIDRVLRHDLRHWLPDDLLERDDRMSMAASMEVRPPLLDHRLVELALRLPTAVKVRGSTKWLLREAARPLLPDAVVARPHAGMRVPLESWLRTGLRDDAWDRLTGTESWVAQTFDRSLVREVVERHERGTTDTGRLWTLLSLEVWHDCFFGATPSVPRPRPGAPAVVATGAGLDAAQP